jgi:hypothetical protein
MAGCTEECLKKALANQDVLNSCQMHEFVEAEPGKFCGDYVCSRCGGRVKMVEAYWYQRGLEHAAQNAGGHR